MQQLSLAYISIVGFSVGIKDLLIKQECEDEIRHITDGLISQSEILTRRLEQNNIIPPLGQTVNEYYENEQIAILNHDYIEPMMKGINPKNSILTLSLCGSTGNLTILRQIIACYGQRTIGSKRLPQTMSYKRASPHFFRFDTSPASRGFVETALKRGVKPTEFVSGTQESRVAIINKTMLTAVTGSQSRINMKNLESIMYTNIGVCETPEFIVQQSFGDTGFDPRMLEHVRFPTVIMNNDEFDKKYNKDPKEFAQLLEDRNLYRKVFISMEENAPQNKFSDVQLIPVNTGRIYEDIIFALYEAPNENERIEKIDASDEELIKMRNMIKSFCENLPYVFYNDGWQKHKGYVSPCYKHGLTLTMINIRSILYTSNLKVINCDILRTMLDKIKCKLIESILEYGTTIGVITAMSVSEPSTQLTLHSIRADVRARVSKKSPIESFKEIVGITKVADAIDPTMSMQLKEGVTIDRAREIANYIEMLKLRDFVNEWQIFYEKYGEPEHPDYKHEKQIINEFDRFKVSDTPTDLLNWCIRFELDRYNMILKNMTLSQIILSLSRKIEDIYIVYTSDNDAVAIVIRIYIRSVKNIGTFEQMKELGEYILDCIVRGIQGIVSAYVDNSTNFSKIKPDGSIGNVNTLMIKTNGVNLIGLFSLQNKFKEIDFRTLQTDNVMETANVFGMSAVRTKIINEMGLVLSGLYYGHYNLIAALMIVLGKCTPITNAGPERRHANSLLRMAHFKPVIVLTKMLKHGEKVNINGISSHLMVGSTPHVGSFYNQICVNIDFVQKHSQDVTDILDAM
jgi:DNA-directed RNA polymerase beta' subunit